MADHSRATTAVGDAMPNAGRRRWLVQRSLRVCVALTVILTFTVGGSLPSTADSLTDQRDRASRQEKQAYDTMVGAQAKASSAAAKLSRSRQRLASAQATLAITRNEVSEAVAADAAMARALSAATRAVERAKRDVVQGKNDIKAHRALIGEVVRTQYQQNTDLAGVAVLLENDSVADLSQRVQFSTTLFDANQAKMDTLLTLQDRLEAAKQRLAVRERGADTARKQAAAHLAATRQLQERATAQAAAVSALVESNARLVVAARRELKNDTDDYQARLSERRAVEQRIKARIAEQQRAAAAAKRAAAAQRRLAEQRRREAARLERLAQERHRAAAQARAKRAADYRAKQRDAAAARARANRAAASARASRAAARSQASSSRSAVSARTSGGWTMPVNGPITSPYGMRLHPVLHVWKLHDGMDFGVGCGTVMRAARSGVVRERYFNAGYGNRLLIDHGPVNGTYYTTAYNHATRYVVSVGQHVAAGQVIGYVGTTGYSTGCHLHLMVYRNGVLTNPATLF